MDQNPFEKANSRSAVQEIAPPLMHIEGSLPRLQQPIYKPDDANEQLASCLVRVHFNFISPSRLGLQSGLFLSGFPTEFFNHLSYARYIPRQLHPL
jgi:hypothetical protein